MTPDDGITPDLPLRVAAAVRKACLETLLRAYEEAGMLGLCAEGRLEAAVDAVRLLDLHALIGPQVDTGSIPDSE